MKTQLHLYLLLALATTATAQIGPRMVEPRIALPLYINGNHQSTDSLPAIVAPPAPNRGATMKSITTYTKETVLATQHAVGTVWGLAYDRSRGLLYSSALLKRHAGLGPLGAGGLYVSNLHTNQTQALTTLDQWGMATGPKVLNRDLQSGLTSSSKDSAVFGLVGRAGLGGLALSADGKALYVTNLHTGTLVKLDLSDTPTPSITAATDFKIPASCTGGQSRPFAVKYHADRVWVGTVCDAGLSQQAKDLRANVYVFDPSTTQFEQVLQVALNYPRQGSSGWYGWTNDFAKTLNTTNPNLPSYPQPILSAIEFDPSGAMLLGLMDRFGHQTGTDQPDPNGYGVYTGVAAGDVLRVAFEMPTQTPQTSYQWKKLFALESNARVGQLRSTGSNNQQGPNGGEFYNQDSFMWGNTTIHSENGSGGLAVVGGQLLHSVHEPSQSFNTAGVAIFDTQTGKKMGGIDLFQNLEAGRFIKGNGVGDIEVIDEQPSVGVGNQVWLDANANTIQDQDESPMPHIELLLYQSERLIGKTQTDAKGKYWFDAQNVEGGLLPNSPYQIRISRQQSGAYLQATSKAQTNITNTEQHIVYSFKTGGIGQSKEDLDIGLKAIDLNDKEGEIGLAIFPNPAERYIDIRYKDNELGDGLAQLDLIDINGKTLKHQSEVIKKGQLRTTIQIQDLSAGTFFVRLKTNGKESSKVIIKQN